jgi:hypothetical protein
MKRASLWFALGFLVLAGCLVFSPLGQQDADRSPLRLKIVRRVQDQGRPVVFFRLEGGGGRRVIVDALGTMAVTRRQRIILTDEVFDTRPEYAPAELWSGSPTAVSEARRVSREEFAVFPPTNAFAWNLLVEFHSEPRLFDRLNSRFQRLKSWAASWTSGKPPPTQSVVVVSTWSTRASNRGWPDPSSGIRSDLIENRPSQPEWPRGATSPGAPR